MAKVEIEMIREAAAKLSMDARQTAELINEVQELARLARLEKPEKDGIRKTFAVILKDANGRLRGVDSLRAWLVRVSAEDEGYGDLVERVADAGRAWNRTKRGRKAPARDIGEVFENVPGKFFKERNLWKVPGLREGVWAIACTGDLDTTQTVVTLGDDEFVKLKEGVWKELLAQKLKIQGLLEGADGKWRKGGDDLGDEADEEPKVGKDAAFKD